MSVFAGLIDKAMGVCNEIFGDPVDYYFSEDGETPLEITAIFEAAGVVIELNGEVPVETRKPTLSVRKSDFDNHRLPAKGDWLTVQGRSYEVVDTSGDDGWAEMKLILMKKGNASYAL
jgi:hypothetical protein